MIKRISLFIYVFVIFSTCAFANASKSIDLFVWALDQKPLLSSKKQIDQLIEFSKSHEVKNLYVQVYRANKAWFPTKHADTSDYDAAHQGSNYDSLAYLISQAHLYDIKVHAWMNMLSLSANTNAQILRKYGFGILTVNKAPKKTIDDYKIDHQFFLEPSDSRVQKELLGIVEDLLKRQVELDGIQFDYIRYPDVHPFYGYSRQNIERFKKQYNRDQVIEEDQFWKQFKRDQVTDLLQKLTKKAKSIRPKIIVSSTGCLSLSRAYHEALQEWPKWIDTGLIDHVTLMNYPYDFETYKKNLDQVQSKIGSMNKVKLGVGFYKFEKSTSEELTKMYNYCQESHALSCVIFHYGNLVNNPKLVDILK